MATTRPRQTSVSHSDISNLLRKRIQSSVWSGHGIQGFLIGRCGPHGSLGVKVTGVSRVKLGHAEEVKEVISECLEPLAGGTQVLGLVVLPHGSLGQTESNPSSLLPDLELKDGPVPWLDHLSIDTCLILCLWPRHGEAPELHDSLTLLMSGDELSILTPKTNPIDSGAEPLVRMQLKGSVPINLNPKIGDFASLQSELEFERLRVQRLVQGGDLVYGFGDNEFLLQSGGGLVCSETRVCNGCKDLCSALGRGPQKGNKGGKSVPPWLPPLQVSLFLRATAETGPSHAYAPIIRHTRGNFSSYNVRAPVDVLLDVDMRQSLFDLHHEMSTAVLKQLGAVFTCLTQHLQTGDGAEHSRRLYAPQVFHFNLPDMEADPVSLVYPAGKAESSLESQRRALLQRLCLPLDRPMLRRSAAGHFLCPNGPSGHLINPHRGLTDPPVPGAIIALTKGYYAYHHYMQDSFNDDKWGCAYRSLQTLVSWFRCQGYTDSPVPSHRDIQQALVDVGDKQPAFVGSRQWIGSFEVSFVLDHLLGVSSKFINVNAGSELSSCGQQLVQHFNTQGTPVMIGGGVLAHTVLGVCYSEASGEIHFLILDPHYTGGEDLGIVQGKGWCGWKGMNFWNQTAHYNLCLPQRPVCV